jgi:hypothetical protein
VIWPINAQPVDIDSDSDGDIDFVSTRGNSKPYDGVFWLEQVRTPAPAGSFRQAGTNDSPRFRCREGCQRRC